MSKIDFIFKGSYIYDDEKFEEIDLDGPEGMAEAYKTGAIKIVLDEVELYDEDGDLLEGITKEDFEKGIQILLLGEEV